MADFNELKMKIKDTVDTAAELAKDIAGKTADCAKDFAGKTADRAKDIAVKTADATKGVARIAKLNVEISSEKETLKKAYAELGRLYYENHHSEPDCFFAQICDEITLSLENIAAKEAEIAALKADIKGTDDEADIDVEFEAIVEEEEASAEISEEDAESAEEAPAEAEPDDDDNDFETDICMHYDEEDKGDHEI